MSTLGLVETKSIAAGVRVADMMMKRAGVDLVKASTICSGRYMIQVSGNREEVKTSVEAARESGAILAGTFVISNISPEVLAALKHAAPVSRNNALAVIECKTATAGIAAADAAVKESGVALPKLVTGQGIMGKSYFVLAGELTAVEAGTSAAKQILGKKLIEAVVIPSPDFSVMNALIKVER
ncbi:MAG: BMC domain-containing protein [Desulfobacteraceae bacterium]|nr:BMC domain-containing protein [Desulfobacteraceae bacterium]